MIANISKRFLTALAVGILLIVMVIIVTSAVPEITTNVLTSNVDTVASLSSISHNPPLKGPFYFA